MGFEPKEINIDMLIRRVGRRGLCDHTRKTFLLPLKAEQLCFSELVLKF
jgi:hypothetical protein